MMFRPMLLAAIFLSGPAFAAPHGGAAFVSDYDTDGDGRVTHAEYDVVRAKRFAATDTSSDGWVSEDEYVGEYHDRLEKQLAASELSDEKKGEERQRQTRQAHVRFGVLDTDKDRKMQKAEYDASGARAFAEHDHDKDGIVTATDVAQTDKVSTDGAKS